MSDLPADREEASILQRCAAALVRHRTAFEAFTRPATQSIVARVERDPGQHVVDLGCGIGDPALALAARLAGVGRVTACDRVDAFVSALAGEARARGLDNVEAVTSDMAALPLPAACCSWVVSRLGLQFAPEPDDVLREVLRILRPEGRALFLVWGPPEQPLLRATVSDVLDACGAPRFELGGLGPFRLSEPGALSTRMNRAGFHSVRETSERATWVWPGNAESFWSATRQTSAPLFDPLFARLDPAARDELERHTLAQLRAFSRGDTLEIPVEVRWAEGTRRTLRAGAQYSTNVCSNVAPEAVGDTIV